VIYGTVLCLGDSMTFGARSEYVRGYPEELAKLLSDHFDQAWTCLNEGVNGECSIDVLRRAFPVIRDCAALPGPKWGCLMVGTNDSKNPDLPMDLYRDNLVQIIRIFRRFHIPLLLGTLPPVKGNCMPCFDTEKSNAWIRRANDAVRELAETFRVVPVEFSDMESYLVDGVHFSHAGYAEMARRWFERITRH
jgi:lysophospholipase L1-like esterase